MSINCYALYGKPLDGGWQPASTGEIWYIPYQVAVRVDASPGDVVAWSTQWLPVDELDPAPNTTAPAGPEPGSESGYATGTYFAGIVAEFNYDDPGELRFTCTVNGVAVPGYCWVVFSTGGGDYPNVASGYESGDGPESPPFWAGFVNTLEII